MPLTDTDRELIATCRELCGPPPQDWNIPFMAMKCRDNMPKVLGLVERLQRDAEELAAIKAVWRGDRDE